MYIYIYISVMLIQAHPYMIQAWQSTLKWICSAARSWSLVLKAALQGQRQRCL